MYEDLKMKLIYGAIDLASTFFSTQASDGTNEKHSANFKKYSSKLEKIIEKRDKEQKTQTPVQVENTTTGVVTEPQMPMENTVVKDMTKEKIEGGVACLACSSDHFSTASGMLNEALRFKNDGMGGWEIQRRLGIALDELNSMERGDLHADQIAMLSGREKEIADNALNNSRDLRHKINAIHSIKDLEDVSAKAANLRTKFMKDIFSLSVTDGTIEKLCVNLDGEERERCMKDINFVMDKQAKEL